MVAWRYEISLLMLRKMFHSFTTLTREVFVNTREILYLYVAMLYPLYHHCLSQLLVYGIDLTESHCTHFSGTMFLFVVVKYCNTNV